MFDYLPDGAPLPPINAWQRTRLLTDILRDVSRAFYLTLRVLPEGVREPVGLAYLLARAADTLADTRALPPRERLGHLLEFRAQVQGPASLGALRALARSLGESGPGVNSDAGDPLGSTPDEQRAEFGRSERPFVPPTSDERPRVEVTASEHSFVAPPPDDRRLTEARATERPFGMPTPGEHRLLAALPAAFALLESLPADDAAAVRGIVDTLTQGMAFDLDTFPPEESGELAALSTADDLDRYTWLVAGCVGDFWTRVTVAHTPGLWHWDVPAMAAVGVRFGKALQLVNVLRDIPRDLRIGRCYLPQCELGALGLRPEDLRDAATAARARPVLQRWIRQALDHFSAAEAYLFAIPPRYLRLRLAVLWPILIGLATLAALVRHDAWLDPRAAVKVRRQWVYGMLAASIPAALFNPLLRRWIGRWRRAVEVGLNA